MDTAHPDDVDSSERTNTSGMGPSRLAQLRADLLLTPEERVLAAQATLEVDRLRRREGPSRIIGFDTYEEYLDYKFTRNAGGG